MVYGLTPATTAVDVAQAFLEAAACGLSDAVDTLEEAVTQPLVLVGSGRALASSVAWRQLVADVTGRPLIPSRVEEASARGAAVAALEGLGWLDPVPEEFEALDGDPVLPDPARSAAFARLRGGGQPGPTDR
jgi:sugar (pentulose or hexulose) kinase